MNKKRLWIRLLAGAGVFALIAAAVIGVFYLKVKNRMERFAEGFSFEGTYNIQISEQETAEDNAFAGTVCGRKENGILHFEIVPKGREDLATDLYHGGGQLLINAERIYEEQKSRIAEERPLIGALLPDWTAGAYISLEQLEEAAGREMHQFLMADSSAWSRKDFQYIHYEDGNPDRLYFQLNGGKTGGYEVIIGIKKDTLFEGPIDCTISIIKENQFQMSLSVIAEPGSGLGLAMPEDVMTEEDVRRLTAVWEAVEKAADFLGNLPL